jgi:hypothetical protein
LQQASNFQSTKLEFILRQTNSLVVSNWENNVTNLLKALRNSGHVVTQQVTSYNNRASVYNPLLSSRQQNNEMPG